VSDISLHNLNGIVAVFGLWLLAGGYFVAAIAFCVASLRTGKRKLHGARMVASLLLGCGLIVGSFQLGRLPVRLLQQLDETMVAWVLPAFALGLLACFKIGKHEPSRSE
jgi:hypothetical protein